MSLPARCLAAILAAAALSAVRAADSPDETRLLRFPATNGEQIVFSYAGQLYTVGPAGGIARRLTSTPGYAIFPRFSPDGKSLAFTAQYDGNTEVYLMPADGGVPKRLTYTATLDRDDLSDRMGPNNLVMTWKNRTPEIVFRSRMHSTDPFNGELCAVDAVGDLPRRLPVPRGGFLSFSPDDTKMAYNRIFREFRTWKDYRGGMSDDIWIFDFKTGALEDITNNPAQDIIPMWAPNGRIYFLSDRDGRMNLFSYELATKTTRQHTHYRDFDIKFPSLGGGAIVYEEAGYIWRFDLASESPRRVPIEVREDGAIGRGGLVEVAKYVTGMMPSPDGQRAVVVARGDLFTVPTKDGPVRNLTDTSGVHERDASWSPDGKWIAYVADATGENELYIRPQDGGGEPVQLTQGADTYYFTPVWSPDSRKLLWSDREDRLRYVDVATKAVTLVATNTTLEFTEYVWSPDSQWIAYTRPETYGESGIHLYAVATGRTCDATDSFYDAGAPSFSDDGKFLLFSSSRDFHPYYSDTEFDHAFLDMQRVYLLALSSATVSPLAPRSDEVAEDKAEPKPDASAKDAPAKDAPAKDNAPKTAPKTTVDPDGLTGRVIGLPVTPANYSNLRLVGDTLYYFRTMDVPQDATPKPDVPAGMVVVYDLKERKETELGGADSYEITADGKHMLVRLGQDAGFIDLPATKIELKDKLRLSEMDVHLDRTAEWRQIYYECWRQMRDFFYNPHMNGVDWAAVRDKYAALLPYVHYRYDLTYLLGEMVGELNNSHTYVGGGDVPAAPRIQTGLLGAELSRDPVTRFYRIDRILPGEDWDLSQRSPLTEVGVNVREGDYILAVDGHPVTGMANIYAALVGTVDRQVVLRVNRRPEEKGARDVTVVPIADETPLYYLAMIRHNLAYVASRTGGRVGYVHLPDMEPDGLSEFAKLYYPQLGKQALIIDDRDNGGGNVSPMIIERLRREFAMIELPRNGEPQPDPSDVLVGPSVLLTNEFSASDGDIFPYRYRYAHLGLIIGKRTWGGAVGIRDPLPLVDGGEIYKPEFAPYTRDGKNWVIEGHGVTPDIVVDNDPAREFAGDDQQLDRAIVEIFKQLDARTRPPLPLPAPPPYRGS